MLVRKGIDLNVVCYEKRCTPLHDAVKAYCEADTAEDLENGASIISLLIEKGCKYQLRNAVRNNYDQVGVRVILIIVFFRITRPLSTLLRIMAKKKEKKSII